MATSNYFTEETEKYVIQFNETTDLVEKERIWTEHLHKPFSKLVECVVANVHGKLTHLLNERFEDLEQETLVHLYSILDKFNPKRGKAFSLFTISAKRHLMLKNIRAEKRLKWFISTDPITPTERTEINHIDVLSLNWYQDAQKSKDRSELIYELYLWWKNFPFKSTKTQQQAKELIDPIFGGHITFVTSQEMKTNEKMTRKLGLQFLAEVTPMAVKHLNKFGNLPLYEDFIKAGATTTPESYAAYQRKMQNKYRQDPKHKEYQRKYQQKYQSEYRLKKQELNRKNNKKFADKRKQKIDELLNKKNIH